MAVRELLKSVAYRTGAFATLHRARLSRCLTVVMLHRVMPESEMWRVGADPTYTISPELLAAIIRFLDRNYAIVSADDVLASLRRERPLPRRPLLITFDDGWHDNLEWALPVLRGIPWTVFIAADAISHPECWWQEVFFWTLRSGRASYRELWDRVVCDRNGATQHDTEDVLALLMRYAALSADDRDKALFVHERGSWFPGTTRHMMTAEELGILRSSGATIGSHGASHLPLSSIADAAEDLARAKARLDPVGALPVVSFPHGRYDHVAIDAARKLGYGALFTSEPALNPCPDGWLQSDVMGRISLIAAAIGDGHGGLAPERLASWLCLRKTISLSTNASATSVRNRKALGSH